jgi:Tol biopolymer transport system component
MAIVAAAAAGVGGAACSASSPEVVTVTVTAPAAKSAVDPDITDLRDTATLVEGRLASSVSGHLGYVGADDNVYVVDPSTGATIQVTDDRSSADTGYGIFHTGLAWSRTGQLVYARTDPDAFKSSLFLTIPGSGKVTRLTDEGGMLIYASWSPATCAVVSCSKLAYIADVDREPGGKVALYVVKFPLGEAHVNATEVADQIYFSWAGERDHLIQHVLDPGSRLDDVDLSTGKSKPIHARLGPFLAPAYTGGRVVYAVADSHVTTPTVKLTDSAVVVHAPRGTRRVVFAPSPDGRRLAFAVRAKSRLRPAEAFEEPYIVDLDTGKMNSVGPLTLWTEAFYWSPDSSKLAYLTYLDTDYRQYNQWRIYDAASDEDVGSVSFQPTLTFDTLTTFFDQFGQSHSFWSPDSRYLTYGAVSDEGEDQIWLLDTRQNGKRILVADGVVGIFSWR